MGRGVESIKFSEFMSGEYKYKGERKKAARKAITKRVVKGAATVTVAKVLGPGMFVVLPLALFATKAMAAGPATAPVITQPEAIPVGAISDAAKEKIIHAFDPLLDLMVSLSLPIAGVMVTGGALMIMIGMKEPGYRLIFNAALGYVLVQMSPLFISLLSGVGSAL